MKSVWKSLQRSFGNSNNAFKVVEPQLLTQDVVTSSTAPAFAEQRPV